MGTRCNVEPPTSITIESQFAATISEANFRRQRPRNQARVSSGGSVTAATTISAPTRRENEHFDWLVRRPAEANIVMADDIRYDEERIVAFVDTLKEPE